MAIALSAVENNDLSLELARYMDQSTLMTNVARREKAAGAPDLAGLSTAVQALVNTVFLALYNQAAPTVLP